MTAACYALGKVKQKRLPSLSVDSTQILPPYKSTTRAQFESPIADPSKRSLA